MTQDDSLSCFGRLGVCVRVRVYACTDVCTQVYGHAHTCTHMCMCARTCVLVRCVYVYVCVRARVCMCVFVWGQRGAVGKGKVLNGLFPSALDLKACGPQSTLVSVR